MHPSGVIIRLPSGERNVGLGLTPAQLYPPGCTHQVNDLYSHSYLPLTPLAGTMVYYCKQPTLDIAPHADNI
jgi:hypothetical protein